MSHLAKGSDELTCKKAAVTQRLKFCTVLNLLDSTALHFKE